MNTPLPTKADNVREIDCSVTSLLNLFAAPWYPPEMRQAADQLKAEALAALEREAGE